MTLTRRSVKAAPASRPWHPWDTHPRRVLHPEHPGHQIFVCRARHKLYLHEAILLSAWLWPVLQAGLGHGEKGEQNRASPRCSASSGGSSLAQCLAPDSPAADLSLHHTHQTTRTAAQSTGTVTRVTANSSQTASWSPRLCGWKTPL